ncbi:MAG: Holliday junction resolvase RuvX [Firmicutes bacterium]|nr:Holliday junction resolvase RuvX [Bacillota bacterium]
MDSRPDEEVVVAVDPGREKCGLAALTLDGRVVYKGIVAPDSVPEAVASLLDSRRADALVIGDRTAMRDVMALLGEALLSRFGSGVVAVDEHLSSVEARSRYLDEHRPRGIARLIPKGMRTPPEPIDDYAAVVLAERYLKTRYAKSCRPPEPDDTQN